MASQKKQTQVAASVGGATSVLRAGAWRWRPETWRRPPVSSELASLSLSLSLSLSHMLLFDPVVPLQRVRHPLQEGREAGWFRRGHSAVDLFLFNLVSDLRGFTHGVIACATPLTSNGLQLLPEPLVLSCGGTPGNGTKGCEYSYLHLCHLRRR
ncbi:hypothetical protein Taro_050754 [Colocasia esculenta]|uniref:Uncharacterized protein n=1 Tax=Colocasia esculenta TaxID=4460 RepID=A0A843XEM1_COLES|nr:hypothetical protein [Colocasia esculenta]